MLESLNKIDTQELKDAHAEANEVKGLINQLIADIAQFRDERINALYYNIWYQGTVNQCTASAVQFLIERLQSDSVQDKDELLLLLAYVARGNSYADVEQDAIESEEQSSQEREWVQNAHNAVATGVPVYLDLLKHEEASVRTCAAYTLACFKEHACDIIPRLHSCIDTEEDELAKSSMLLCLAAFTESAGFLGKAAPKRGVGIPAWGAGNPHHPLSPLEDGKPPICQQLLTEITNQQTTSLVKLAASMALARLTKENTPPEALHVLVDTIVEPESIKDKYVELPWANMDVVGDTSRSLYALGPGAGRIAIPILTEALRTANAPNALRVADALLHVAFNGELVNTDITAQALTDEQRLVLTAIANSDCAWVIDIINIGKAA